MDAIKALKTRQSNRKFLPYSIDLKIIEDILDCARLAPSAMNRQGWHFVAVDDKDLKKKVADATMYGKFLADAPVAICVFGETGDYIVEDCAAATENILLAATAHDLGCCWVAGYKKPHSGDISKLLNAPKNYELVSLVAIGQVKEQAGRAEKKPLADVMSYNKFE